MTTPVIKIENLKKHFDDSKVIDGISLEINYGDIFGIIGASGSGKTTFLNSLIGFYQPSGGKVYFNKSTEGKPKFQPVLQNLNEIKKRFGFASQHPSFYSKLTVFENLDYFGSLYNLSQEARLNNITTLLELVELTHAKNILAKNLSGGMQRRLDMACALIHNPEVLLLDEPTSDLDLVLAKNIWGLIKKINKRGTTIIVASHDLPEVESICTKIGILSEGKIKHIGSVEELKHMLSKGQEIHIETYPGNYDNIIKNLKDPLITSVENRGSSFIIHTQKPDKVLGKLLTTLSKLDENLLDVKITKLNLRDVFTKITKK